MRHQLVSPQFIDSAFTKARFRFGFNRVSMAGEIVAARFQSPERRKGVFGYESA